jgi:hypothetical protein
VFLVLQLGFGLGDGRWGNEEEAILPSSGGFGMLVLHSAGNVLFYTFSFVFACIAWHCMAILGLFLDGEARNGRDDGDIHTSWRLEMMGWMDGCFCFAFCEVNCCSKCMVFRLG